MQSRRTKRWSTIAAAVVVVLAAGFLSGCPDGSLLDLIEPNGDTNGGELPTYTVTYHRNDATSGAVPDVQTKTHGVELTLATNSGGLARTGYTLAGWNSAADGSGTDYAEGATYTEDASVTLYGRWTDLPTYTVTYHANNATSGTVPAPQTKIQEVALTLATNSGNLARTGYTFAGWNTAADGSGTDYAEVATYTTDADLTLYAKWTDLPTYTVSYDANNATSGTVPESQTKTHGVVMNLASNSGNLARTGYTFAGWNTAADGSGTNYAEGAIYTDDADSTLYARWWSGGIGDDGPAGGKVFYDKGAYSDGWRYLEAWTADEDGTYQWKSGISSSPGTSTIIGSGYSNTYTAMTVGEHPAAEVVRNATHGGYSDWFLPSKEELNEIYVRRFSIGNFTTGFYWSSSESDASNAWRHYFYNGSQTEASKDFKLRVRAARAF